MKTATIFAFKIIRLGSENLEISSWPFELTLDFKSVKQIDSNYSLPIISQELIEIPWANQTDNRDRGTIELVKFELNEEEIKDIVFHYTFKQWCPYRKQVIFDQCILTRDSIGPIEDKLYDSFAHQKSVITSNIAYRFDFTYKTEQWKFLKWVTKYYNHVNHIHDKHWNSALGILETYAEDQLYKEIKLVPTLVQDNKEKPFEGKNFIDFNELSDYGLIWKINKEILHPLGLALARNEDGTSNGCIVAPDGVWEYDKETDERNLEKYDNFLNLLK